MPTGPANAPDTDMNAAPGNSREPVASQATPRVYLSALTGGRRPPRATSSTSGTQTAGVAVNHGSPMSTTSTCPASVAAGPTTSAGFRQPKVTVTSARTDGPSTAPVSTSTPLGTSTLTTT